MEPVFKSYPAFKAIGMSYKGSSKNNEIPELWNKFIPRMKEVPNQTSTGASYGVARDFEGAEKGEFEYIAAMEVENADEIPEGMIAIEVPEQHYAMFTYKGPISGIQQAVTDIYSSWAPQSGRKMTGTYFELYDERFKGEDPASELDIYVSVEK